MLTLKTILVKANTTKRITLSGDFGIKNVGIKECLLYSSTNIAFTSVAPDSGMLPFTGGQYGGTHYKFLPLNNKLPNCINIKNSSNADAYATVVIEDVGGEGYANYFSDIK